MTSDALPRLLDLLHRGNPADRQKAALRLGTLDTTEVMPELVALMALEDDDFVRETLIWAVVARPTAAAPALVSALGHALPKEPVLHALSKVGDPATVPAILAFAEDADPVVAAKAWWALGRIAAAEGLDVLISQLGSERAELRHGLTRALLEFGAPSVDALEQALSSDSPAVRSHAAEVLTAFADPTRYSSAERRAGSELAGRAATVLRGATAPEVDGALLLATISDDRPGLAAAAAGLRDERRGD
ncbi:MULTISPECIES: HEAT repeat domain-containing protein [unclassified Luteococcus]|uniref:HEAT repeat domain-containing protein n=1 Tax=unclassified Luteococcus TaxID=2639923 RepID=UPI00313BB327